MDEGTRRNAAENAAHQRRSPSVKGARRLLLLLVLGIVLLNLVLFLMTL